jgi:hypothetical protein
VLLIAPTCSNYSQSSLCPFIGSRTKLSPRAVLLEVLALDGVEEGGIPLSPSQVAENCGSNFSGNSNFCEHPVATGRVTAAVLAGRDFSLYPGQRRRLQGRFQVPQFRVPCRTRLPNWLQSSRSRCCCRSASRRKQSRPLT